jgi:molybdopterin-guanine dinucleotide biosynthesis protein A
MDVRPKSVDTVVLAGGVNRISLYDGYTPGFKALVDINGRASIRRVLDALEGSRYVGRVCIVGSQEALGAAVGGTPVVYQPPDDNPLGSFLRGLRVFEDSVRVLVTAADLPLLTPAITDAFIEACAAAPTEYAASLYLPVVRKEMFTGLLAGTRKAINHFRDGTYAHGNLALVDPGILRTATALDRMNAMYAARKSEVRSALALGLGVGLSYVVGVHLLHALTLKQMASIASKRFGIGIVPVTVPFPELAIDVDEPADYQVVQHVLRGAGAVPR